MMPAAFRHYGDLIRRRRPSGPVLEIGAVVSQSTLLCLPELAGAGLRVGVNLDPPARVGGAVILSANAHHLPFRDATFGIVLCNAVFEHDPEFWRSLAEIHRVTRPGGFIAIGAPGYMRTWRDSVQGLLRRVPILRFAALGQYLIRFTKSTATIYVHEAPGDYYRFSVQAFTEVLMAKLDQVEVTALLYPPVIIGAGVKPPAAGA